MCVMHVSVISFSSPNQFSKLLLIWLHVRLPQESREAFFCKQHTHHKAKPCPQVPSESITVDKAKGLLKLPTHRYPRTAFRDPIIEVLSHVRFFAALSTVAHQAPHSSGFSLQEYWCAPPFPSPGHLPNPGIKPASPALQVGSLRLSHQGRSL